MPVQNERVSRESLERSLNDQQSACESYQQRLEAVQQEVNDLKQQLSTAQEVNVMICIGHCDKDVLV